MTWAMPLYEVKYPESDVWYEISDLELMDELYKTCKKFTPTIKEMINGREVETPYGIFRLKIKGGEHTELSAA